MRRTAGVILSAAILAGCTVQPPSVDATAWRGDAALYVVSRGWHTDIALPVDMFGLPLAALTYGDPRIRYLVFGFGERAFLMARNSGSAEMLTALFPSDSALLMTTLAASPSEAFADHDVVRLQVDPAIVRRVAAQIWRSIQPQPDGSVRPLAPGPYAGSLFFAAVDIYDLLHTCNSWTAIVLRDAGLPINPNGVVFVHQLMQQLHGLAAAEQ